MYYCGIHNAAKIEACGSNFGPSLSRNISRHQRQTIRVLLDSLLSFSCHLSFLSSSQQCAKQMPKKNKKTMKANVHFCHLVSILGLWESSVLSYYLLFRR